MSFRRASLLLIAAGSVAVSASDQAIANNLSPAQSLVVLEAREKAADSARLTAFIDSSPELSTFTFKPGVAERKFDPSWSITDALELPSGALYLSVAPPLPPEAAAGEVPQKAGTLRDGVFTPIAVPDKPLAIGYIGTLGGRPVITTVAPSGRFVVVNSATRRLAPDEKLDVHESSTDFALHDGSSCAKGSVGSTTAIEAHQNGGSRVLVTTAAIQRAFGWPIHVDPLELVCATFDGEDFLNIDDYLIFKLQHGELSLIARGRIWAAGLHHILMTSESLPQDPHPSYYLEATAP